MRVGYTMDTRNVCQEILLIEPFYGGSHKQLVDTLANDLGRKAALFTLPAKKWHWRARTSALHFSRVIPKGHKFRVLFASSVLSLAELVALRPDLLPLKKILYFHENQLLYPVRKEQERDFQYGYNQIVSREHDKGPEDFFDVIFQLHKEGLPFILSVIGEQFSSVPDIFQVAQDYFKDNIKHWGYQDSKDAYFSVLRSADVVISTARHEFFGVAMLEAAFCGCYPLAPRRLVYPEIFPDECLYNTKNQLVKKLRDFCRHPDIPKTKMQQLILKLNRFTWSSLKDQYQDLFNV